MTPEAESTFSLCVVAAEAWRRRGDLAALQELRHAGTQVARWTRAEESPDRLTPKLRPLFEDGHQTAILPLMQRPVFEWIEVGPAEVPGAPPFPREGEP